MSGFSVSVGPAGVRYAVDSLFPEHSWYVRPDVEALGLRALHDAGDDIALLGEALRGNVEALCQPPSDFDRLFPMSNAARWLEIAELLRSTGEAISLIVAALREVQGLLDDPRHDLAVTVPLLAAFTSEATSQYLISAGHQLTNVGFRLAMESPADHGRLQLAKGRWPGRLAAADPDSDNPTGWLFHSVASDLRQMLGSSTTATARFVGVTARLSRARDWQQLNTERNRYFHRWRHGFSSGGSEAHAAARQFHSANLAAVRCLGRALPSLYYTFFRAVPKSRKAGTTWGMPLQSEIEHGVLGGPMAPLPRPKTFRG